MKDWIGNSNSIYKTLGASNHTNKERQNEDYYATDPNEKIKYVGSEISSRYVEMSKKRIATLKTKRHYFNVGSIAHNGKSIGEVF